MNDARGGGKSARDGLDSQYNGPKDIGRADSLYESALTKPDPEYALQLFFWALVANPEHDRAITAILDKSPTLGPTRKRIPSKIATILTGNPADDFVRTLANYCAAPSLDLAADCAAEAKKIRLFPHVAAIGERITTQLESGEAALKIPALLKILDTLEAAGSFTLAIRTMTWALAAFPDSAELKEREKNLLARKFLSEQAKTSDFRDNLQDRAKQESAQRTATPASRLEELQQHYLQSQRLEDFREFVRALRESPADRREAAIPTLQDAYERFGERDILWLIREIKLQRRSAEVRAHERQLAQQPDNPQLQSELQRLRQDTLRDEIDHLYEVVSALPPSPDRQKREMALSQKLLLAGRFEESIKQAQILKRRPECRLDSWVVMAKAFVQLGLTIEAEACFESVLKELATDPAGPGARALDAKYSYAEFLLQQAAQKQNHELARQARKICADVMLEDIDYREIRSLSTRAESLTKKS